MWAGDGGDRDKRSNSRPVLNGEYQLCRPAILVVVGAVVIVEDDGGDRVDENDVNAFVVDDDDDDDDGGGGGGGICEVGKGSFLLEMNLVTIG